MALAANQAGGAWQAGPLYSPLLASGAGGSWATPAAPPQAPGYNALLPTEAGASWQGAQPYTALQPGSAGAQWVGQAPNNPSGHVAAGFCTTGFGTPERWIKPPTKLVRAEGWQTGSFGTPVLPIQAMPIMVGVSFGTPRSTLHTSVGGGGVPITALARGWRNSRFGSPTALISLQVQAHGWHGARFGQPVARQTLQAAAIAPATAFGTPAAQLQMRAQARGWQSSRFGAPLLQRRGNAEGFAATRFGTPTTKATFRAQAHGFRASAFGTPAMAWVVRALPMSPSTRFGRPTRTGSTEC